MRDELDIKCEFEDRVELFKDITDGMLDLYKRKNADYGSSVTDTYNKFGLDSYLVRMYDKLNRAYTISRKNKETLVKDEKLEDTLRDLANYSILALIDLKLS